MSSCFTAKQEILISDFKHRNLKRINILEGSVRSGKTYISLILWALWVATSPQDGNYLMIGKTMTTLKRNCLELLETLVGSANFTFSTPAKEGRLFGRKVMFEGAGDARSEAKIRGLTLNGAYVDEMTMIPEDFFVMLLTRLSAIGAKLFGTTNPDNPNHWLKKNYLDRSNEINLYSMKFSIDDNTFLPPEYVEGLKKEFSGVFYDRFILGLWKAAEGVIYRQFADDPKRYIVDKAPEGIRLAWIGVDFGGNGSAHAFCLVGTDAKLQTLYVLDEYYRKEIITPTQLDKDFVEFVRAAKDRYPVYECLADSAETVLIAGLKSAIAKERIPVGVRNALKRPTNDRIRFLSRMMATDRFKIMGHCKKTIEALETAVWDSKHITEDVRLDDGSTNIDSLDALEYAVEREMKNFIR